MKNIVETIGMFIAVVWLVIMWTICAAIVTVFYALVVCLPLTGLLAVVYFFLKACGVVA